MAIARAHTQINKLTWRMKSKNKMKYAIHMEYPTIEQEWTEKRSMKEGTETRRGEVEVEKEGEKNRTADNTKRKKMSNKYHVIETFIKQIHQTNWFNILTIDIKVMSTCFYSDVVVAVAVVISAVLNQLFNSVVFAVISLLTWHRLSIEYVEADWMFCLFWIRA